MQRGDGEKPRAQQSAAGSQYTPVVSASGGGRSDQRYAMPMQPNYQIQYPYKYPPGVPNVMYPGQSSQSNLMCYYMNESESQPPVAMSGKSGGVNNGYPNVLPVMYHQGNVFPASPQPTAAAAAAAQAPPPPPPPPVPPPPQQAQNYYQYPARHQFPMYQYYPVYPSLPPSHSRDGSGVYLDNSGSSGVLPSLQIQQPLMPQQRGKQQLSLPFNSAAIQHPPILTQQPLPLPTAPITNGPINDTNDNTNERNDEDEEKKPSKQTADQGYLHKCHLCNKSFKRRSWLKRHLLSHSPDRHFACPWCLSKHKRKDNLLQHMKLKHTDYVLQELRLHNIKVDGGFLTISNNNNIRSLLYEGKLNKDEVKKVLNSLIDRHNHVRT